MFIANLRPSTRLALQASIALTCVIVLSSFLPLDHAYWAMITAMLLISQTLGEGLKKASERVLMTILGGVVGTALYFVSKDVPTLFLIFIVSSVFFIIYYFDTSFRFAVFFMTISVVFLFAMLKSWNADLLLVRIYETIIGAFFAIFTGAVVLPIRAANKLNRSAEELITQLEAVLDNLFKFLFLDKKDHRQFKKLYANIVVQFLLFRKVAKITSFERWARAIDPKDPTRMAEKLRALTYYLTTALHIVQLIPVAPHTPLLIEKLESLKKDFLENLSRLKSFFSENGQAAKIEFLDIPVSNCLNDFKSVETWSKEDYFNFRALMYNLSCANAIFADFFGL